MPVAPHNTPLEPTGKLSPQPWMTSPETQALVAALQTGEAEVRFVGGCVRDAVLKRPVSDIDLATPEPPERIMELLTAAGIRTIATGLSHGTVTAVVGQQHYEITTLRRDVETDGRHATVAFSRNWTEDAARRDLTINALSCSLEGDIYDPFNGLNDLAYGRIRFVGRAAERIAEDVLRLLRFFRFYADLGHPPVDKDALAACRAQAHKLSQLSGERIAGELFRLLATDTPAPVISLMQAERILPFLLPEASGGVSGLRTLCWLETRAIVMPSLVTDPLRRLAALIVAKSGNDQENNDAERRVQAIADRLRLSNHQRARLIAMTAPPPPDLPQPGPWEGDDLHRALYRLGPDTVRDRALLAWAELLARQGRRPLAESTRWRMVIEATETWCPPTFPLCGQDVLALGVPAGPAVGEALRQVENWWLDTGLRADRDHCLEQLRQRVSMLANSTTGKIRLDEEKPKI